ncbi:MAG: hypothetical protein V1763_00635 [Parcubacteria group bacterium]
MAKKCIVCEKKLEGKEIIEKHDVYFCDEKCVIIYEEKLAKMKESMDWDKCC